MISKKELVMLVTPPHCSDEVTEEGANLVERYSCVQVRSSFGGPDDEGHELQERPADNATSASRAESSDLSQQYGYKYEYGLQEDDDENVSSPLGDSVQLIDKQPLISNQHIFVTKSQERIPYVYLLGRTFHPAYEYQSRKEFEASLYWFTYRWDFPEIKPYGITSDAGWGCMLRSAQMLLAHTLRIHFKSRNWKPPTSNTKGRDDPFITSLLTWFADFPSTTESIYSLHNMVAAGLAKYETLPGEWYGPGTACYVLRDLVGLHQQRQSSLFRVHIASEGGTIYRDAVRSLMTKESKLRAEEREREKQKSSEPFTPLHPLDPSIPPPPSLQDDENLDWDTSLLLLIPLRLGLDNFNTDYNESLSRTFWLPQSVGILGGRPRGARWFFGAYADGTKVLGLDPHTVQSAPQRKNAHAPAGNHTKQSVVDLSDEYMSSVHTLYPEVFPINRMDPSIALGFYCRDKNDFTDLEASLKQLKTNSSSPDLFTFADHAPDYSLSSAVNNMVLGDSIIDDMNGDGSAEDSDEDEYVLL